MNRESPEERVRLGVGWLNEVEPGWMSRIDLDTLDISKGDECIAGQLSGRRDIDAYHRFFYNHGIRTSAERVRFARAHGFLGTSVDDSDDIALTKAWKQAITALRG